jgi:hypothetical protein
MPCCDARGSPRAASALNQTPNLMDVPVEGFLRRQELSSVCLPVNSLGATAIHNQPLVWRRHHGPLEATRRSWLQGIQRMPTATARLDERSRTRAMPAGEWPGRPGGTPVIPSARCQRFGSEIEFSQKSVSQTSDTGEKLAVVSCVQS